MLIPMPFGRLTSEDHGQNRFIFTSIGFDPALFMTRMGGIINDLEWETREKVIKRRGILFLRRSTCLQVNASLASRNARIHLVCGSTSNINIGRCIAGIYRHGLCSWCGKSVAQKPFGPYEAHPSGEPILTSSPRHLFSLGDPDAGHFEMVNPHSVMQKAGHGSLVHTHTDEWFMAHLIQDP